MEWHIRAIVLDINMGVGRVEGGVRVVDTLGVPRETGEPSKRRSVP